MGLTRLTAAVVIGFALCLAACRSQPSAPPAAASSSVPGGTAAPRPTATPGTSAACKLLTTAEVNAAVGVGMDASDGTPGRDRPTSICEYKSPERILIVRFNPESGAKDINAFPLANPVSILGLGDIAKYSPGGSDGFSWLMAVRGPVSLSVLYRGPGDHLQVSTGIAQAALARI